MCFQFSLDARNRAVGGEIYTREKKKYRHFDDFMFEPRSHIPRKNNHCFLSFTPIGTMLSPRLHLGKSNRSSAAHSRRPSKERKQKSYPSSARLNRKSSRTRPALRNLSNTRASPHDNKIDVFAHQGNVDLWKQERSTHRRTPVTKSALKSKNDGKKSSRSSRSGSTVSRSRSVRILEEPRDSESDSSWMSDDYIPEDQIQRKRVKSCKYLKGVYLLQK